MSRNDLGQRLREVGVPDSSAACERVVTAARGEAGAPEGRLRSDQAWRRRVLVIACGLGLIGTVLLTPPGRAATGWVGDLVGIGEVGGPPTREERDQGAPVARSVVVATGHAPDGARYEYVVDRFPTGEGPKAPTGEGVEGPDGETFKWCLGLEWPDVVPHGIGGFCGPQFPPAQREGLIRPFGGLNLYEGVTEHLVLSGFAEPEVSRVRVLYRGEDGQQHEAPADFFGADRMLKDRTGSDRDFGFFVAFIPPSFPLGTGTRPFDREAIDVIAYNSSGHEVARAHPADFVNGATVQN